MDTITIEIEDKSMTAILRKFLGSMKGVKILHESVKVTETKSRNANTPHFS